MMSSWVRAESLDFVLSLNIDGHENPRGDALTSDANVSQFSAGIETRERVRVPTAIPLR
jgi:hypothetical protein